ncbi:DUF4265 domain-containing protein [Paenibacillus faecis]|uniref:DUF4265 domain-containing protein n=1 Tax=Paenibacillus faecis TaxID=862114 RepID=UPI00147935F7|nr:DUF4265 domain-containing protein [Paenibacillus faecis]
MRTIKKSDQIQLCFDDKGGEVEVLDVVFIDEDTVALEENPIFNDQVSYGDIVRVKKVKEVYYYIETIKKSELIKLSWLLSKEVSESQELENLKDKVTKNAGRCERVFGGLLLLNIPKKFEQEIIREMKIILNTEG